MKKTIAIDFDGVIHKYSKGFGDGTIYDDPMEGAFESIERLKNNGLSVFIFSARASEEIIEWLKKFGVVAVKIPGDTVLWESDELGVTQKKYPAIAYVDDRGVRFTNWKDICNYYA